MSKLKDKRIFIASDNEINMAVFSTLLRRQGSEVLQDGWNIGIITFLLNNCPIDLILLDLFTQNGQSGYEVFDQIQLCPELRDIPIIATSTMDAEAEIPKVQAKGFAGFISKPINAIKFPTQLATCLEGAPVWVTSRY